MKRMIVLSILVFGLVGCGSDTTTYVETPVENLEEPGIIPKGDAIIVDGGESVTVTSSSVIIDCGGGCGDVTVGTEIIDDTSDNSDNSDDNSECSGGGCGK